MFEPPVVDSLAASGCADALAASVVARRREDAELLALAAHWADLHHVDRDRRSRDEAGKLRIEYGVPGGADGTPNVGEFAAVELGMLLQTTTTSARRLMRDALDLRHRHPAHNHAALTGVLEVWKARKVAQATSAAGLSEEQARWVDAETIDGVIGLPWLRAEAVVAAKIIAADPAKHESRRAAETERRYVSVGRRSNEFGLRSLIAQTTAGDVARIEAMIVHLAALMATAGDTDPADTRRAKALALLANPAMACVFLANAHGQTRPAKAQAELPAACPEEEAERPSRREPPSAVDLAVAFGSVLNSLGDKALERLRPKTVLYLHLAQEAIGDSTTGPTAPGTQVARAEGLCPLSIAQLREWLATDHVMVKPVLDPAGLPPVDSYEIPRLLREGLHLTYPFEVFPYGTAASRRLVGFGTDTDHSNRYVAPDNGGPAGQTRLDNLGPLGRTHHRAKTFGGFTLHRPLPGMFLWCTPTGHWFQVDNQGSHPLGRETPAILQPLDQQSASRIEYAFSELALIA